MLQLAKDNPKEFVEILQKCSQFCMGLGGVVFILPTIAFQGLNGQFLLSISLYSAMLALALSSVLYFTILMKKDVVINYVKNHDTKYIVRYFFIFSFFGLLAISFFIFNIS
ncbi:MAG: hypothetical protein ACRCWR_08100, partial [Saezia sp.]